jgi:predicted metalloprotease
MRRFCHCICFGARNWSSFSNIVRNFIKSTINAATPIEANKLLVAPKLQVGFYTVVSKQFNREMNNVLDHCDTEEDLDAISAPKDNPIQSDVQGNVIRASFTVKISE